MFIYKITAGTQIYIGLDTKPTYKQSRWKAHCKQASAENPIYKVHKEMKLLALNTVTTKFYLIILHLLET